MARTKEELRQMAELVLGARRAEKKSRERAGLRTSPAYYMLCAGHPVTDALYRRYRIENGLSLQYPPGDLDKTMFELSLFNDETLRLLDHMLGNLARQQPEATRYEDMEG